MLRSGNMTASESFWFREDREVAFMDGHERRVPSAAHQTPPQTRGFLRYVGCQPRGPREPGRCFGSKDYAATETGGHSASGGSDRIDSAGFTTSTGGGAGSGAPPAQATPFHRSAGRTRLVGLHRTDRISRGACCFLLRWLHSPGRTSFVFVDSSVRRRRGAEVQAEAQGTRACARDAARGGRGSSAFGTRARRHS